MFPVSPNVNGFSDLPGSLTSEKVVVLLFQVPSRRCVWHPSGELLKGEVESDAEVLNIFAEELPIGRGATVELRE